MAQVSAQKCSLCDENTGTYYCYECQHALCTVCFKRHGKIPALREHTVVDINRIDISTINKNNQCVTHNKEIQIYCEDCSNLICIKCVTSTHQSHTILDITEVVVKEREKVKENIKELKLKIEAISSLQVKIRREHIEKLHVESEKCIGHIESVFKDLLSYIEAKRSLKTTEVEDNEKSENQNFEAFLKKTGLIHKQYLNILSELENVLLEKHDVSFYSGYRSIQKDIETLISIPVEPPVAQVPSFDDESEYREVLEHIMSKMDKRDIEMKNDELQKLSQENQFMKAASSRLWKFSSGESSPLLSYRRTDITIVLMGRIGSGKSHTGNTIIGFNQFKHGFGPIPVTEEMDFAEVNISDTEHYQLRLTVIDTPGLQKFEEFGKFQKEITHRLRGICFYLFVMPVGRFLSKDKILLEGLLKSKTDIGFRTGIVLTRSAELTNRTVHQWIMDFPTLKRLIDDYHVPYEAIENADNNGKPRKCLIRLIKELHSKETQRDANKVITVACHEMKDSFGNNGVQFFNRMYEKKMREEKIPFRIPFFH